MNSKLKFHHVAIKFYDIDNAIEYFKKFGFEIVSSFTTKNGKRIVCLKKDGFIIEACQSNSLPDAKGQLKHLAFLVGNIKQAVKDLKNNGIEIIEDVTKSEDEDGSIFYFAYFKGPENLKLELHQEGYEKSS